MTPETTPARAEPAFDALLDRVLDGAAIDWSASALALPQHADELESLRTIAELGLAFRRCAAAVDTAPPEPALFEWGPLAALEKIAEGASAEVYRAWEPGLATTVALKLLRADAAEDGLRASDFLREAHVLTRVRHRNIVSVYGAATHDGRPGLWCEWIDGANLDTLLREQGPFGAVEAAHVGAEVCTALAHCHAQGLLHGDVKAGNVLRERGGRIVLADFGAVGTPAQLNASLHSQGTLAYLPPEVRDGAPRALEHDLYAVGVLLYRLLDDDYPDGQPLHRRRADVPDALCAAIDRAIDPDPARRYRDAASFARDLRLAVAPPPATAGRTPRRLWLVAAAFFALAAVLLADRWWPRPSPHAQRVALELVRVDGDRGTTLRSGDAVALGDRLYVTASAERPLWLYAFNADDAGVHLLFPLPDLEQHNPLPAGQALEIPGRWQGRRLTWEVATPAAHEEFLIVSADASVDALEALRADLPGATLPGLERGVTRLAVTPEPRPLPERRLDAIAAQLDAAQRRGELTLHRFRVTHR